MDFLFFPALAGFVLFTITVFVYGPNQVKTWWFDACNWFREQYVLRLASLIKPYILAREKLARQKGDESGYQRGLNDGKNVWEVSDSRDIPDERELDESVYGPELFPVTAAICDKMKQEVAAAVAKKIVSSPSPEQWEMILSSHPSTCVLAGAGSGKSTTLVLRIMFMMVHLGVSADKMTIVSFTNDSCKDLRKKLVKVAPHWGVPINKQNARQLVRTFHSALYKMGKAAFPRVDWFENIGREENDDESVENPFASNINSQQVEHLKSAYLDLYKSDATFKKSVLAMLEIETSLEITAPEANDKNDNEWMIKVASERDKALVDLVNDRWKQRGLWPIENVDPEPFELFRVGQHPFYANGKVISTGLPVFLGAGSKEDALFSKKDMIGQQPFPVTGAIGVKRNIVGWRFGKPSVYLASSDTAGSLVLRMKYIDTPCATGDAPMFKIRLNGEKSRVELLEAFSAQASFIESMGLEVSEFVRNMRPFRERDIDHHFCTALGRFWPHFESHLWSKGIMTFNRGFNRLSADLENPKKRSQLVQLCLPLTHLLIDEFQDISSQIVTWVRNAQRLLAIENQRPSIMAIGDDWQSIYGWRGSSPEFFIRFDRFFKVHSELDKKSNKCPMGENFRSIPEVVGDGSKVLRNVAMKTAKNVCSNVPKDEGDHGVILVPKGNREDDAYQKEIVKVVHQQYEQMNARPVGDENKVLVIGRTNTFIGAIEDEVGTKKGLVFRTIHSSKGLQAEAAIICEDCTHEGPHPIRDRVYALLKNFDCKSYEEAQRDEALRLAYVAVTRGIRRVYWFAGKAEAAAKTLISNT